MSIPPASEPQGPEPVTRAPGQWPADLASTAPSAYPAPAYPTATVQPTNGAATASLVLGIVSIVTSLLFLPAIIGLVLGIVGVGRSRRSRPQVGRGKAIAGIVLSTIGLLTGIGIVSALTSGDDSGTGSAQAPIVQPQESEDGKTEGGEATEPTAAAEEPVAEPELPGVGDAVRDGKFEFTVTKVEPGVKEIGDEFLSQEAQGQFVLVHLTVENIGDESQYFDGNNVTGYDAKNREFAADTEAAIYLDDSNSFLNEINPGNSVMGVVVFDVPADVKLSQLELHDSAFSGGVEVALG
ncbi:protein of unknown function (DUF4190) [Promicromonospora umidemergens]|uniref:DUF4352 domain-containing protein n=1 Tax=Promicromonospora umidemergens TaxID=629679 RepID=A0ABP8WQJ9_9MICO|nr:DUF4352 domain-containing protein [Promicromonospora umidemergens]MCP2283414.1 protein of unknown function (DUF4190) [Promicromonospora umidemergens]